MHDRNNNQQKIFIRPNKKELAKLQLLTNPSHSAQKRIVFLAEAVYTDERSVRLS